MGGKLNKFSFRRFLNIPKAFWTAIVRFVMHDDSSKAASLSFYTLTAAVPILAILFGIARLVGLDKMLEDDLTARFEGEKAIIGMIIEFARAQLEHTHAGIIAGAGIVVLLWTTLSLLGSIEAALNSIWGVDAMRGYSHRILHYLTVVIFLPVLFVGASSITVAAAEEIGALTHSTLVWAAPYFLSWLLFTAIYWIMPNVTVPFRYALFSGLLAGTLYQLTQWLYINAQVTVNSYGAIYGSFAFFPLLLIWLQVSWSIVLAGAEFCAALEKSKIPY